MQIEYSTKFIKQLRRAPKQIQLAAVKRIRIFRNQPTAKELRNHVLKGNYSGCRSINITGDWRAVYQEFDGGQTAYFLALGTHSQLYR